MRPDITTILVTLVLPIAVLFCVGWATTTLRLRNRRKRAYLANLHRYYNTRL